MLQPPPSPFPSFWRARAQHHAPAWATRLARFRDVHSWVHFTWSSEGPRAWPRKPIKLEATSRSPAESPTLQPYKSSMIAFRSLWERGSFSSSLFRGPDAAAAFRVQLERRSPISDLGPFSSPYETRQDLFGNCHRNSLMGTLDFVTCPPPSPPRRKGGEPVA